MCPQPVFVGTIEAVRFASLLPENLGAGVYLMELALAESGHVDGTASLVLRWLPLAPDDRTAEEVGPTERVLIEDVVALELSYFGTMDSAQPPDWWQAWEGRRGTASADQGAIELPRERRARLAGADRPADGRSCARIWVIGTG